MTARSTMTEAFARRYKLLDRIAIGGTAEVFRALFLTGDGDERPVVIKRVLPQYARDERFRRLFHEEACVAVTMTHPSIVRVLDYGDIGATCFIALEMVDGKDLAALLAAGQSAGRPVTSPLAALIAAQVGAALQFIHQQTSSEGTALHIIHRDVSPQNILVSYRGEVKLTDFGIAKSAIRRDQTVDGTLRGKLDYMSPEQAGLGDVDHRTDLFALGCVLYEMLHGTPPFRAESEIETLERVRQCRAVRPVEELEAPPALKQVLSKLLVLRREERYQSAEGLVHELGEYLHSVTPPVTAATLAAWVTQTAAIPVADASSQVDEAVRRLLGEADELESARAGTTVFASTSMSGLAGSRPGPPLDKTSETRLPPSRRFPLTLFAVALLGVSGWLLWALSLTGGHDRHEAAVDRGAATSAPPETNRSDAQLRASASDLAVGSLVFLRSTPLGATVLQAGREVGVTPIELRLPAEPCVLELRRAGYRTWRKRVDPNELGSVLSVALIADPGSDAAQLTVNSLPWSRVRVDGRVVGNTPLVAHRVRPGTHIVELLSGEGQLRRSFRAVLPPRSRRSYSFDFTKEGP